MCVYVREKKKIAHEEIERERERERGEQAGVEVGYLPSTPGTRVQSPGGPLNKSTGSPYPLEQGESSSAAWSQEDIALKPNQPTKRERVESSERK